MMQTLRSNLLKNLLIFSSLFGCIGVVHAQSIIKIDGSSTVYPITKVAADQFEATKQNTIKVAMSISGSGGGLKKLCRGEIDIANASRPISKKELAECKSAKIQFIEIPVAFDALTVVISPQNTWSTAMTIAELKKTWEPAAQGKIMQWNHVNSAWPNDIINLYVTDRDSGTFDYFTEAIVGRAKFSRNDFNKSENDNTLAKDIAHNKNGLGFLGFAYYLDNQTQIKAVAIDSGKGYGAVLPSVESVEDGSYQPLSRPAFIYVNAKSAEKPEVREFVTFYLKNAVLIAKEARLFPLPPRAYTTMLEHFNKKRVGTVFDGVSAVGLTIDDLIRREGRLEFEHH
ncbi:MAG: PstS family phosphate ABC transporter substrate-binding protein [Nitrosomonas sp.]